jgi:hypothetical protein
VIKIHFKKSGGVLGREIDREIDLGELPEAEAQEVTRLLGQSSFFNIPQNLIAQSMPDEYEYTITVQSGNTEHTVQTTDSNAPESLRPLLEKLSQLARVDTAGSTK